MARMRLAGLVSAVIAVCAAAPASAHFPQHVDATVVPNGTVSETSSAIPDTATSATVTVKPPAADAGDFFTGVATTIAKLGSKRERVLTCVSIYKALGDAFDDPQDPEKAQSSLRLLFLAACLELAFQDNPAAPARAVAAAACPVTPTTTPIRITHTSAGFAIHFRGKRTRPKRPALEVTCRRVGGALKITMRPRSRRRSLRSVAGPKLSIGFYNHGSAAVPMRTTFAVR
ncbi:MAG: hypothetical protein JWM71_2239 [Solirubrobacteraceae bacterium]|nr:hypothetical protein [Solirubrobacteraceae bacterium]